ncbi:MAG: type II restriction endonuclease subunit M [Prevotella sp.]|nr:type II restriction endonuclease subunit M [Prevotella sp.]
MQNITYRFIQNVGDYFPSGYFTDDFITKVQNCAGRSADDMKALCSPYVQIRGEYEEYKNFIINGRARVEDKIKHTHDWHTTLLKKLGYDTDNPYQEPYVVKDGGEDSPTEIIPVRHILRNGNQVSMLIMEMQNLITVGDTEPDGLFKQQYEDDRSSGQQRYYAGQWRQVIPAEYLDREKYRFSPAIINKAITQIFLMPEECRPHYILMLAGNQVFLFDSDKWARGSYLQLSLDDLYFQGQIKNYRLHYALFHLLCCKEALAADGQTVLMDSLIEESYKNAYEVTKDLKEGVIFAVETLANEALYYWKQHNNIPVSDYTDDTFEAEVKDDCLTIIYRLLFLFYAESREELEILPIGDEVYKLGYSLESLRDLEMMRLNSQASRDGYFFDDSIRHLFGLLANGHHAAESNIANKSFRVRPIDSPLFNNKNLHHLADVRIRNIKWQEIIKALSLSKKKNYCGRISYANLGVNQLGSVYESLLAFRGFYAEEDYIEVHKANEPQDSTFLVPYSRMGDFDISEVLTNPETGAPQILPKGTFVYRLNGRDRQKSASYYTPEVLTRSTVKYTLKSIIDDVRDNKRKATELLELKILEPAMGAAAFQNEVINQLAEAYLQHQQRQQREAGLTNWRISPDQYRNELQKVKAYIATHNVYGVDLNPTAVELGKLSLWLNVIHKDMETPFFANRICVGNAVIGAWLKVYSKNEFYGISERYGAKLKPNKWWEKAPHKVKFFANRVNRSVNDVYHFLLPDANMLGVRSIKEQKKEHPAEEKQMAAILKDWTAPIASYDFKTLQRLSAKIDILLKDYFTDQISIEKYTNNRREIWDGIDHSGSESLFKEEEQAESYARKQTLFDTRYGHNNAYRKLKLAMDYWCSLWFWEYKDADNLPTRQEYWADIEALLDVDNEKLDNRTRKALERTDMVSEDIDMEYNRISEDESQIVAKTQEELLTAAHGNTNLFSDEDPLRLKIVCRLSERYRFFHPMLEFIEVFWLRDGFDIICGNPPWLKLEFDEQGIISEKYPEIAIRNVSAPQARTMRDAFFNASPLLKQLYIDEETENACSAVFLNAKCNYPLLEGQQTNLFKCIIENGFSLLSDNGFMGLLHPEGVYDDPKGQILRKEIYLRLRYHFQYQNALNLFPIGHREKYGTSIYGNKKINVIFNSINNLFIPQTIDACFAHDGHGTCGGIKVDEKWNIAGHKDRIVHITEKELKVMADTFEQGADPQSAKLVSIHAQQIMNVLEAFADFPKHVGDFNVNITVDLDETGAVNEGIIKRETFYPNVENYEMVYNGPQIYVGNPSYKTPRTVCVNKADYDTIDLSSISNEYIARSNYRPIMPLSEYKKQVQGFCIGQDEKGNDVYDDWIDHYKVGFRKMINLSGERSLICAVLPRRTAHINGVISSSFVRGDDTVDIAALCASIPMDFFMKTIAAQNLTSVRMQGFPLGIDEKYNNAMRSRTLLLNCLTTHYADLWQEMWDGAYKNETWSLRDKRLKPFDQLHETWSWDIPLRNYFERRQALVEIDVISAMALGLSLQDLEMIYTIQFPVLQQNENDTWYDSKGNIVFTCSKGLTGVGLDRKQWEAMRGEPNNPNNPNNPITSYKGSTATYVHTIDPKKSELYGGQQVTYYAPYTRCDRIADYRRAWAHFEKIYNK